ncbi:protein phosphatase 1J isoform X4 [Physeter macrocephalus]|uniref:Protein phosphatase 1J isoform X4 n=1 Tax=Physeter macrocephalus TaxID=9755 RepID=A0A455B781_PHYMC|nr:protein phosphatase 1J isoform X4 [Physeter catodon]|eukprot:XP_028344805.1 protein phosphatase 1J isoform X5 [Physeter catodon]
MLNRVRSAVAHLVSSGGAPPPRPKSPDLPNSTSAPPAAPPQGPRSPPARAGSGSAAPARTVEARASFSRPTFLQLSPGGLRRADDHAGRAVQSPPDTGRRLPWSTGYAEVINAGKSRHNEDQACCEVVYVEGRRSVSGAPREPSRGQGLCFYYWGLFDGHAGGRAAEMASRLLHRHIREQLKDLVEILQDPSPPPLCLPSTPGAPGSSDSSHLVGPQSCWSSQKEVTHESLVVGAIENAFQFMDEQMARERRGHQVEGGCCALVVVYLLGKVYVANAGDSRAIIVRNGEIIPMSREFTPETERQRLQMLARMMATIGVTRGLGDHNLRVCSSTLPIKPFLSSFPEVRVYDLTQYEHCPDDVLVLGTDGLWDVTSDCEVAATVDRVLSAYEPNDPSRYTALAQALVLGARGTPRDRGWRLPNNKLGSGDDISVFVIPLGGPGSYS